MKTTTANKLLPGQVFTLGNYTLTVKAVHKAVARGYVVVLVEERTTFTPNSQWSGRADTVVETK